MDGMGDDDDCGNIVQGNGICAAAPGYCGDLRGCGGSDDDVTVIRL